MIDVLFEQRVIQNTSLGAEAIWQTVNEAYETRGRTEGVALPLAFLVLPLAFHQRTALALATKQQPGALYKALADDRELIVGLQTRMQAMSTRTFHALSIGFQSGLLLLDPDHERHLIPSRKTQPVPHFTEDVKTILSAAKRVGQAFAEMSLVQLSTQLNIRF
jgi:hypothetical protein